MPQFAWELPSGPLRESIEPVLGIRALLPQIQIESRLQTLRLLNGDEKTVLRIQLESGSCQGPQAHALGGLSERVRLQPMKGYQKALRRVYKQLQLELGLQPAERDLLLEALGTLGVDPAGYSTQLQFQFTPRTPAGLAAREIHLHLLGTLEANVPGARAGTDSEFLHDLRVATRRARSALSQIKGVLAEEDVVRFQQMLGWIGQITGPTRDLDVYLLAFPGYRDSLPEQVRGDLNPLHDYLVEHQRAAQEALAKRLGSPHFRKIVKEWRALLEAPPADSDVAPNAERPIGQVASERIYKIYKRVLKEGLAIDADTQAEHLHELRKNCKKLRYLMEFFQSLYPRKRIRGLVRVVKVLLDNLGSFQDLEVQADKLRALGRQMMDEGKAPAETLLAMGMLVDGLLRRQGEVRGEFAQTFAEFAEAENQREFKALFGQAAGSAGTKVT